MPEPQERQDDGLQGLPAKEREETEKIIEDIRKGEAEASKPAPEAPKPDTPPAAAEQPPKPADKPADTPPEKPAPEKRTEAKLIPRSVLVQKTKEWDAERAELIKKATPPEKPKDDVPADEVPPPAPAAKVEMPPEFKEDMEKVRRFNEAAEAREAEAAFSKDFDKYVLPALKLEYGDDVPKAIVDDILEDLKDKAHQPEFANVPLSMLYKGDDMFRKRVPPPATGGGARGNRPGQAASSPTTEGDLDLSKDLSPEEIEKLSTKDFETYMANMEKQERERKRR